MKHQTKGGFNCGCGKAYPYYSSLWKHIKNKHNSISPKGTYKPLAAGRM